jgi:hypothetical protein
MRIVYTLYQKSILMGDPTPLLAIFPPRGWRGLAWTWILESLTKVVCSTFVA